MSVRKVGVGEGCCDCQIRSDSGQVGSVSPVIECLPGKYKVLSSNLSFKKSDNDSGQSSS
jgi:hypothetical protein